MARATSALIMGLFVLTLSVLMWRLTDNFYAWALFFSAGGCLTARGWALALRVDE